MVIRITPSGITRSVSILSARLNQAIGVSALIENVIGSANTVMGDSALSHNVNGSFNTVIGYFAGASVEGDDNIYIGATTADGVTSESRTIRIGDPNFISGCYIGGISGQSASGGVAVFVNGNGKLGTLTSSARFKENIAPMDQASESIFGLKPVTFRYKKTIDPQCVAQFGLVAEEVEKVNPDLVVRDNAGLPYSVRYEQINAMLLNEFLKEHRTVQEQGTTIARLERQVEELASHLQKLSAQIELSSAGVQTVLNDR